MPDSGDIPRRAEKEDIAALRQKLDAGKGMMGFLFVRPGIAAAAAAFEDSCIGDHAYENNCAHFLSDAFLRAGYQDLHNNHNCVDGGARCFERRPIRARNMWCWFQGRAQENTRQLKKNTGMWAVFQLDESAYWGGHVCIVDTDTGDIPTDWVYYGTGYYPEWDQYAYQWQAERRFFLS